MAAANTDKLRKVARRWVGQIGSGGVADDSVTTIPLSSTTNLPTDTAVSVVIDRVDANGTETPSSEETVIGVVSGTNLINCVRGEEGTAQAHDAGAVVEVLLTANLWKDMVDWGVTEHNQDGTHDWDSMGSTESIYRQALINGNFDVWQRGTSFVSSSYAGGAVADRWRAFRNAYAADGTISRQDGTGVDGSRYCLRFARDSGTSGTGNRQLYYCALETHNAILFRGSKMTLSFWARKGANYSSTSDYLVSLISTGTGTDENVNSFTGEATAATQNNVLTTSWQKFTMTTSAVIADSINEITIAFTSTCTGTAGAADYFEITQVQLCAGEVALPFQPKSYGDELKACKRYFERIEPNAADSAITNGSLSSTTNAFCILPFEVEKRAIPTTTFSAVDAFEVRAAAGTFTTSAMSDNAPSTKAITIVATVAGATAGQGCYIRDAGGAGYIDIDAEL